eukprot:3929167-Rhodomonas_salina.1
MVGWEGPPPPPEAQLSLSEAANLQSSHNQLKVASGGSLSQGPPAAAQRLSEGDGAQGGTRVGIPASTQYY